jgi:hypothetical protein
LSVLNLKLAPVCGSALCELQIRKVQFAESFRVQRQAGWVDYQ